MPKSNDRTLKINLRHPFRSYFTGLVTLAVVGLGTPVRAQESPLNCDGQWHTVPAGDLARRFGDFNSLNAVAAISSTDVWAVGQFRRFQGKDYDRTFVEHWDGTSWNAILTPRPTMPICILDGVAATASNDVWAVGYEENLGSGYQTLIEHWDGTAWTIVQDATYKGWLTSVTAIAPDDVWAVGSTDYIGEGLIEHWDGSTWTRTAFRDAIFFRGVTAISQGDVWAVGQLSHDGFGDYTYAAHFDGSNWSQVATPSPLQKHDIDQNWLTSVSALASNDVWAVGLVRDPDYGILDRTLSEHWDGTEWKVVSTPHQGENVNNDLWGVIAFAPNNIWAVGSVGNDPDFQPLIEKWDGTAWLPVATPPIDGVLLGVSGIDSMELWASGNRIKQNRYTGTLVQHLCTE